MTSIRELLDEATRDVVTDAHDATERVRRGVRARRKNAAAIAAAVAVVIAAIVLPLSLVGGGSKAVTPGQPQPNRVPVLQRWTNEDGAAAAGFGAIWALHTCGTTACHSWVDELDPNTGKQLSRIDTTLSGRQVATGLGLVWVLGITRGVGPAIVVINPTTHEVHDVDLAGTVFGSGSEGQAEPGDIAFAGTSAWITYPKADRVVRLAQPASSPSQWFSLLPDSLPLAGEPTEIATTGTGEIWVRRVRSNKLTQIAPASHYSSVSSTIQMVKTVIWGSPIFSATDPSKTVLALGAGATVGTLEPSLLNNCLACAQGGGFFAKGTVNAVLQTTRGWWVATSERTYFYDHKSFRSGGQPTASLSGQASSLAPDGRGVIVGNPIIGLFRWTPRGA